MGKIVKTDHASGVFPTLCITAICASVFALWKLLVHHFDMRPITTTAGEQLLQAEIGQYRFLKGNDRKAFIDKMTGKLAEKTGVVGETAVAELSKVTRGYKLPWSSPRLLIYESLESSKLVS